ncbi:MAG TPA: RNA polymerase sigma factor [Opitutaceae bacterium]|jgi:RNA polymerase sigma-70 factor (ECF subfamily)
MEVTREAGPSPEELALDRELVRRMAGGDAQALREFYQRHVNGVAGLISCILRDREEARDAVQEAFIKVWRSAGVYRPERAEVMGWLIFIARNSAIDRLRKQRRELARRSELFPAEDMAAPTDTAEEVNLRLDELSVSQRQALKLAFFEDCSQAEIATRMQVPVTTVKNHLHRGLARLRQLKGAHAIGRGSR